MKKKIIYIMNVDWNWIKQRPHFIAERLAEKYETKIVYRYKYNRKKLQNRDSKGLNLIPIYLIPKLSSFKGFAWINDRLLETKIRVLIKKECPDIVYVTYPTHVSTIPDSFRGRIIYDCMDNHSAFCSNIKIQSKIERNENRLISKSYKTLVTSEYLKRVIKDRYSASDEYLTLVRNAYEGIIVDQIKEKCISATFNMAYIGTLSSWFDWNTIMYVLDNRENVNLHLYGPVDKTSIPKHKRIIYHGTIEHNKLYDTIKSMDALIMPFIINDIIKAVDPVKLYEYINFGKDIIMCHYDEVNRFNEFVYFYDTANDFLKNIESIRSSTSVKYTSDDRIKFLKNNNWDNRVKQILDIIEY